MHQKIGQNHIFLIDFYYYLSLYIHYEHKLLNMHKEQVLIEYKGILVDQLKEILYQIYILFYIQTYIHFCKTFALSIKVKFPIFIPLLGNSDLNLFLFYSQLH